MRHCEHCDSISCQYPDHHILTLCPCSHSLEANSQTSINSSGSQSASTPPPLVPSYCPQGNDNDEATLNHIYETTECCKLSSATASTLEISEDVERGKDKEEEEEQKEGEGRGEEENEREESDQNGKSNQDNHCYEQGELMRALYSYQAGDEDELTFTEGDEVQVVEHCDGGWAKAFLGDDFGYVPESYFELVK